MAFGILVFWCVLPILNAVWDALSWAVSWFLLTHLRQSLQKIENGRHVTDNPLRDALRPLIVVIKRISLIAVHVFADLILAIIFLFGIFVFVVLAIELSNNVISEMRPEYVIDLRETITDMVHSPWDGDGFWLASLIFSTLIPTFVHFVIAFCSLFILALAPSELNITLKNLADISASDSDRRSAIFWVVTRASFLFLVGGMLFVGLWVLLWNTVSPIRFQTMLIEIHDAVTGYVSVLFL
jgi:hypothetical protein